MIRLTSSAASLAWLALPAWVALSAGCASGPADAEPGATGSAAVQTAIARVTKCPKGEVLTCDPTENGHGVVCDCAYPPPDVVRASGEEQPALLHKCPPGQELTCDPTQNGHGVVCDCAYPPAP